MTVDLEEKTNAEARARKLIVVSSEPASEPASEPVSEIEEEIEEDE